MNIEKTTTYKVTLTLQQAYILWRLLCQVGGDPKGPCGEMNKLEESLCHYIKDFKDQPEIKFVDPNDQYNSGHSPSIYIEKSNKILS